MQPDIATCNGSPEIYLQQISFFTRQIARKIEMCNTRFDTALFKENTVCCRSDLIFV